MDFLPTMLLACDIGCNGIRASAPKYETEQNNRIGRGFRYLFGLGQIWPDRCFDADSLTRTDDLPLTRRLLYQLSYAGVP